jgi:hypothetical protein
MIEPLKLPVEEMLSEGEFTDRVEILYHLEQWYKNIKHRISSSNALISPRRMGKTALLDRLVNIVFFKDYEVAPFYFKMKREETTLRRFVLEYYTTFFRQYIAYILQDPYLYEENSLSSTDLLKLPTSNEKVHFIQQNYLARFIARFENSDWRDARNLWEDMIKVPEILGKRLGIHVAVIIDEFQDMKFYIYDADDEKEIDPKIHRPTDLTATYDRQAQSRRAPMLVSGSAVTMIFRTVMGGPLGGRFGFTYLKPMAIEDGATLIKNLLRLRESTISDELAIYLSAQVNGHPYYIYCCAESACPEKDFDTGEAIDRIIHYEVTKGKIFGFWETHFAVNRHYINEDNDLELGKKIIYYFTKYNNAPVKIDEIAAKLKVSRLLVTEKIEKLYQADLVYRSDFKYFTFNDICLMRYIQTRYEAELEGIEKVDLQVQGTFNYLKGKLLEQVVQNIMSRFADDELPGVLFGYPGQQMVLPRFRKHGDLVVKLADTAEYQIDAYGEFIREEDLVLWVVECKYRKREPMNTAEVSKMCEAAATAKEIRKAREVVVWLVATGGFTADALEMIRANGWLYSGQEEINQIVKFYGINIKIVEL